MRITKEPQWCKLTLNGAFYVNLYIIELEFHLAVSTCCGDTTGNVMKYLQSYEKFPLR